MNEVKTGIKDQVTHLLDEAYAARINNLNDSIALAEEALQISRECGNSSLTAKSLSHLSLFYMIMGEYSISTQMAEEALEYFTELNDEKGIADVKYNLAGIYYKTDNYHLGLIYLLDCLSIYKKYNDHHNQARAQKSLGTIYEYFGDRRNAIKAYESSVDAAVKAGDKNLESNAYNPLSGIFLKQGRTEEALSIIEKSIALKEASGDVRGLAFALYGRGKVYTAIKKYKEAERDFNECIKIHTEVGERLGAGMAYRKLGLLYMDMYLLQEAKQAFHRALEVSDKYNIAIIRFKSHYHLYQIYKKEDDNINALQHLEYYLKDKEAVITTQTLQVIENYELIGKMESLEKEAQLQREKAEIIEKKNRAEQAFKIRQEFLSTMSHEIRTPLNAVIMISSLLKDRSDAEEQQLLTSLKFAANNLLLIINDILDFTKLDSGKARLELRPCNFYDLLENISNTYESLASEKGLELALHIDDSIAPSYELDEIKLSQILGNIVSNAIKYTDKGNVDIVVSRKETNDEKDLLSFEVKDTGPGISAEFQREIFDSFSQEQSVTTRKQGGSGLGLAIVKKLVNLYGSEVYVSSEIGQGSVFYFDLRLKRSAIPDKAQEKRLDALKNKTVLLAEDNMVNAMVAIKLLSNWGMRTEHAKNGLEAIELSKTKIFDFILMDLHMPEVNGFDAATAIRHSGNPNHNTPVFALTADITADQVEEYLACFNGFLKKPIEIDKMYDALTLV